MKNEICLSDRRTHRALKCLFMETVRLRAIQQPSRVERLLTAFALRSGIMPPDAYMIRDQKAMPAELQGIIFQAMRRERAWCCWKHGSRVWLLTCDMLLDLSRKHGSPALDIQLYGENGELKDSDTWVLEKEGRWHRGAGQDSPATIQTSAASPRSDCSRE